MTIPKSPLSHQRLIAYRSNQVAITISIEFGNEHPFSDMIPLGGLGNDHGMRIVRRNYIKRDCSAALS